jgi:hypothetical protein
MLGRTWIVQGMTTPPLPIPRAWRLCYQATAEKILLSATLQRRGRGGKKSWGRGKKEARHPTALLPMEYLVSQVTERW